MPILALFLCGLWMAQPWPVLPSPSQGATVPAFSPEALRAHVTFLCGSTVARNHTRPATLRRAAAYIEAQLIATGATVQRDDFSHEGEVYRNIVASFGNQAAPAVVLGAHYDVAEETACGADDNASAVAGLLELAAALSRQTPAERVDLVFYTLEEPPHFGTPAMGSRRHAAQLARAGIQPRLVLVLEMIGYFSEQPHSQLFPLPGMGLFYPNRGDFIALVGGFQQARELARLRDTMTSSSPLPVVSLAAPAWMPGAALSDHASYWEHGIPALMLTDTAFYRNPNYHRPGDLPETLDYQRMTQVLQGVMGLLRWTTRKDENS